MEDQDYEKITLSNVWLKQHVLDPLSLISEYEFLAEFGPEDYQVQPTKNKSVQERYYETIDKFKLECLSKATIKLAVMLGDISPYITSKIFKEVSKHLGILTVGMKRNGKYFIILLRANSPNHFTLTKEYESVALPLFKETKKVLLGEIADKEFLIPKKSKESDKQIEEEFEDARP